MSPEQLACARLVDARTDIWSVGIMLFEMLTGKPPFDGPSLTAVTVVVVKEDPPKPSSLRPEIPAELEAAILRCLQKDPADRYPDVAALGEALAPFGSDAGRALVEHVKRVQLAAARSSVPGTPGESPAPPPVAAPSGEHGAPDGDAAPDSAPQAGGEAGAKSPEAPAAADGADASRESPKRDSSRSRASQATRREGKRPKGHRTANGKRPPAAEASSERSARTESVWEHDEQQPKAPTERGRFPAWARYLLVSVAAFSAGALLVVRGCIGAGAPRTDGALQAAAQSSASAGPLASSPSPPSGPAVSAEPSAAAASAGASAADDADSGPALADAAAQASAAASAEPDAGTRPHRHRNEPEDIYPDDTPRRPKKRPDGGRYWMPRDL
jgi:serine/threonine-protein kinase